MFPSFKPVQIDESKTAASGARFIKMTLTFAKQELKSFLGAGGLSCTFVCCCDIEYRDFQ